LDQSVVEQFPDVAGSQPERLEHASCVLAKRGRRTELVGASVANIRRHPARGLHGASDRMLLFRKEVPRPKLRTINQVTAILDRRERETPLLAVVEDVLFRTLPKGWPGKLVDLFGVCCAPFGC
jgi:hypothetical protein